MEYTVLSRKWRPKTFDNVVGQSHITTILKNSIEQNKVSHAYLFSGPRGVGKTTVARIMSCMLNNVELIDHFENGILFDLESDILIDVMNKIDSDHDLQKKLSKNSIKKVHENNSLEIILDKEYEIYKNISKY